MQQLKFDGELEIAIGKSRKETSWKNTTTTWSALVEKLSQTHRTVETVAEYKAATVARQAELKDVGGFVAGSIHGGRRKADSITSRSALTLDLDFAKPGFWNNFSVLYDCAALVYSTHKHTAKSPRLRLVIPLNRPVYTDEYTAIARKIASSLGINDFDDTTFEPSRLMYWPSTSADGEYEFHVSDGEWLDADEVLAQYKDWHDISQWPTSDRVKDIITSDIKKQGDPLEKTGLIGAFCREFAISEAIELYLEGIYEPVANDDKRYTYTLGSTAGGVVVYEDKFAFSHHGTDPAGGLCVNAWDLVRIHKFGLKDKDARDGTNTSKLPSFSAMSELVSKEPRVRKRLALERLEDAKAKFDDIEFDEELEVDTPYDDKWLGELETDKQGNCMATINNAVLVLRNDKYLRGAFALDKFEKREVATKHLPWRKINRNTKYLADSDDVQVRHYVETRYKLTSKQAIQDGMTLICEENSFHPVKEYIDTLVWDGTERLNNLFIDYLGADDNAYTKAIARKMCTAAVARIYTPGCKFDNVVTLIGSQGMGKSTFVAKLGGEWYSDSFGTIQGKEAYEAIQGVWIVEMAEMAGMKKAEKEQIKHFISKRDDRYRVAYGKRTENFPRQCIFIPTTNEEDPLEDPTGNRRYWVCPCKIENAKKSIFDDLSNEVDQIWAEAKVRFEEHEPLYLSTELSTFAADMQQAHVMKDDRSRMVNKILDMPVPAEWSDMEHFERLDYINAGKYVGKPIEKVTPEYIWTLVFKRDPADLNKASAKDIRYIMSLLDNWEAKPIKISGVTVRGYMRKSNFHL
jgi:predicted P-loop ATPase